MQPIVHDDVVIVLPVPLPLVVEVIEGAIGVDVACPPFGGVKIGGRKFVTENLLVAIRHIGAVNAITA